MKGVLVGDAYIDEGGKMVRPSGRNVIVDGEGVICSTCTAVIVLTLEVCLFWLGDSPAAVVWIRKGRELIACHQSRNDSFAAQQN